MATPLYDDPAERTDEVRLRDLIPNAPLRLLAMVDGEVVSHDLPSSGRLTLGRGRGNDVAVTHASVSRDHAFVELSPLAIIDRGSRNGTFVGGEPIEPGRPAPLAPGDPVRIGDVVVMIQARAPARPGTDRGEGAPPPVNLIAECARAARSGSPFVYARLHVDPAVAARALDVVLGTLRASDALSTDAPGELCLLFPDTPADAAPIVLERITGALARQGMNARGAGAAYPRDGITAAQLAARAWQHVLQPPGAPDPMDGVRDRLARLAAGELSILLTGETGVGKELFAEMLHRCSGRARGPMIKVNCAALTETLLESALFGHEKGAFTGATSAQRGLVEAAEGGTLFLDEIGEMSAPLQSKLLRVLEDRELRRVGATEAQRIDVRFVAASNRALDGEAAAGRFRRDLLFRIAGATITIPPLRQRPGEIEAITRALLELTPARADAARPALSDDARAALIAWSWPGNVRELRNAVERAALMARDGVIHAWDLGLAAAELDASETLELPAPREPGPRLSASVEAHERARILDVLDQCGGNKSQAARVLGISRNTLLARLDDWGLREPKK